MSNPLTNRRLRYEEDDDPGSDDGHDYLGQRNELQRSKARGSVPERQDRYFLSVLQRINSKTGWVKS